MDNLSPDQIKEALQARRRNSTAKFAGIDRNGRVKTAQTVEGLGKVWTSWELLPPPDASVKRDSKPRWRFW